MKGQSNGIVVSIESWFLEKIVVKEDFTASKYIFYHNDWITSPSLEEFTETGILLKGDNINMKDTYI